MHRQGEAARQEEVARQGRAVRSAQPVHSVRTAAARGAQGRENPPEEDREVAHSRLSRRAAVVRVKTLNLVIWLSGHLVNDLGQS